mmetsp:Transcript_17583/g.38883  ORF Transcript_17583/g.38883 Transcript_17583/m.38883 type:complete len:105 (-) Transcript_17583:2919-3233(-)
MSADSSSAASDASAAAAASSLPVPQCRRYRYHHRSDALISILNSVSSWYLGTYSNKSRLAKTTMIKGFPQFGEKGIGIIVIHKMREFQRLHASVRLGEAVSRHF